MSSVNIKKITPSTAMYVMMTPIPGRSKERTLSTKRIGLDGSSQNLRWMGEYNTEWLHARTSMLLFHRSISTSADNLLHGLYTCCAYILWDLVDVNVIETNSQPASDEVQLGEEIAQMFFHMYPMYFYTYMWDIPVCWEDQKDVVYYVSHISIHKNHHYLCQLRDGNKKSYVCI